MFWKENTSKMGERMVESDDYGESRPALLSLPECVMIVNLLT